MGRLVRTPLLVLVLAFQTTSFLLIDRRCTPAEKAVLDVAVKESKVIAQAAVDALNSGKVGNSEDAFKGAYDPLFGPDARASVKSVMERAVSLHDDQAYGVSIYCDAGIDEILHEIQGPPHRWEDWDFQNIGKGVPDPQDPSRPKKVFPGFVSQRPSELDPAATLIGYVPLPGYEFTNQAHIYMTKYAIERDASKYDTRPVMQIKQLGFSSGRSELDSIESATTILLHELMHVAGGLRDPNGKLPGQRIKDGPKNDIYGWRKCVMVAASFPTMGIKTQEIADCLMKFALACYLQPQYKDGAPTCWNLGNVDPNTGKPAPLGDTWLKRSLEVIEARARWHARAFV